MIRTYQKKDIPTILNYLKEFGIYNYTIQDNPFLNILVYENLKEILGFIIYSRMYERAEIEYIYITEENRKKGIAHSLIKAMEKDCMNNNCKNITLEVRKSNAPAHNLYQKQGYKEISIRKNYYKNEDAILMEKVIE